MKFIGNFKDWATPELLSIIEKHDGKTSYVWDPDRWAGHPALDQIREKSELHYTDPRFCFNQFDAWSPEIKHLNLTLPIPITRQQSYWWIIKLKPGKMQPVHVDPHTVERKNTIRYSMFLKDWEPGHIFLYEDKALMNYKAGDMYEWIYPTMEHGVANIGFTNRFTLQITMFDE